MVDWISGKARKRRVGIGWECPQAIVGMVDQDQQIQKEDGWAIHIFPEHDKEPMLGPREEIKAWWRNGRTRWTLTGVMQQDF